MSAIADYEIWLRDTGRADCHRSRQAYLASDLESWASWNRAVLARVTEGGQYAEAECEEPPDYWPPEDDGGAWLADAYTDAAEEYARELADR